MVAKSVVLCRDMFNKETLGKMKKGAWLVNTARGGIVNRDDIVEALESGHIAGAQQKACSVKLRAMHICIASERSSSWQHQPN